MSTVSTVLLARRPRTLLRVASWPAGASLRCTAPDCATGVPSPPVPVQTWAIVACRMAVVLLPPHRSVRYGRFPGGAARGELRMLIPTRGTVREPRTTTAATVARTRRTSACAGAGVQHACDLLRAGAAAALNGARIGWPLGPRGRDGVCALQPNAEVSSEQLRESPFAPFRAVPPTAACMAHTCQGTHAGWWVLSLARHVCGAASLGRQEMSCLTSPRYRG